MSEAWNPTRWLSAPRGSFKPAPGLAVAPHLLLVRPVTGAHELNLWVADQLTLQIEVAVKFAPLDAGVSAAAAPGTESGEDVHRFLRQARCAAKIADPHLLQILEQGRVKGDIPFLVTELLEGKSLSQRLLKGPLSISHAHAVLSQAAGVLAKAHPLGLWHGSLWPEHLFLIEATGKPFLKLANFGDVSLRTWANDPVSGLAPDAPSRAQAYLSPEQLLHGTGSSAAADIWSLGVLLYELLTTTLPFEAPTSAGVSVAICNAQFSPPSHYRADLPPAVDAWFRRVFAQEQSARLLDPAALAREFARALGQSGEAIGQSGDVAHLSAEAVSVELGDDYDGDERTVRWDLPSDWSSPLEGDGSLRAPAQETPAQQTLSQPPYEPERSSRLPSTGPPPLPDRPPSSRPPPPFLGYSTAPSFRAPAARLPSLPPPAARVTLPSLPPPAARATLTGVSSRVTAKRSFALRYHVSKGQGLAAGALLGGVVACLAWGLQSWRDQHDAASPAGAAAEARTAPLAAVDSASSAAPPASSARTASLRARSRANEAENLPVILQTDELPRAPEETDEEEDSTGAAIRPRAALPAAPAAAPSMAPSRAKLDPMVHAEGGARPDPGVTARAPVVKPRAAPPAVTAATPRRDTPHRSAQQVGASADCNPPYFFDKNNIRRLKLECL